MDKSQLNNEIVLCRSAVKRARVCVIRRLIKKIKILRSCKNEELREKKFRKARRLAAEIHVMKSLSPDYVTKFALITEDYVPTGSNTKLKRKRNACSKLAKHKYLTERVTVIRGKFTNWREELPILLQSVSKKNKLDGNETPANVEESTTVDARRENESGESMSDSSDQDNHSPGMEKEEDEDRHEDHNEFLDKTVEFSQPKINCGNTTANISKPKANGNLIADNKVKRKGKVKDDRSEKRSKNKKEKGDEGSKGGFKNGELGLKEVVDKVDDPFFIGKKVRAPTLEQSEKIRENQCEDVKRERKRKLNREIEREIKPTRGRGKISEKLDTRLIEPLTEDELHPSWKAKKMQTIKPFEGKKIKFE